jgi:hypothetical protein
LYRPRSSSIVVIIASLLSGAQALGAGGYAPVIQPSAQEWVAAAQYSRADMLVLGDSTVTHFFGGMTDAAKNTFGLAGSGLITMHSDLNTGYSITPPQPLGSYNWTQGTEAIAPDMRDYAWSQNLASTAGSTPAQGLGFWLGPSPYLNPAAAYDWHVYTSSPGDGSMAARRRLGRQPYTLLQSLPAVPTGTNPDGLTHSVFSFGALPDQYAGDITLGDLHDVTNTTVFYSRLIKPNTTGVTVSGWTYGGKMTLDFLQDKYLGGPTSPRGRQQMLSALTDGGSGKLMVVIFEGLNDRGYDWRPSYSGLLPGNTPAAYVDNISALVNAIRTDWIGAGKNVDDLSIVTIGNYEWEADQTSSLGREYAAALREYAQSDPNVSFIDLWNVSPTYQQSRQLNYIDDPVHATFDGTKVFSDGFFKTLTGYWRDADATLDGIVDYQDFVRLYENFGKPGHKYQGDFNGDNFVDFADFQILERAFDDALASQGLEVPEPAATTILGVFAVSVLCRRRRLSAHAA